MNKANARMKHEVKNLLRKKKQIQNLKLQKQIQSKLDGRMPRAASGRSLTCFVVRCQLGPALAH